MQKARILSKTLRSQRAPRLIQQSQSICAHLRLFPLRSMSFAGHAAAKKIRLLLAPLSLLLTASLSLHAQGISEPDTIFYGQVFHNTDQPILASEGEVKIKAVVNGNILAEYILKTGNHNYALRVPMDNGGTPGLNNTASPLDPINIYIENIQQGSSNEADETKPNGYAIPAGRGSVIPLDLTIATDVGQITDTSTNYETWLRSYFSSSDLNDPAKEATHWGEQVDIDGDGRSNLVEYALGLNPRDPDDADEGVEMEVHGNAQSQRHLYVTFNQRLNDPSLVYRPEVSNDQQVWSSNFDKLREYDSSYAEGGSFRRTTYQDLTPGTPGQPRHFQLTIERQPQN